jgi:hypothetical protein
MGRLPAHIRLPLSSTLAASFLAFAQSATGSRNFQAGLPKSRASEDCLTSMGTMIQS